MHAYACAKFLFCFYRRVCACSKYSTNDWRGVNRTNCILCEFQSCGINLTGSNC